MAKVTIREYDSSEPSVLTGAYDLPIYIPGYANFGPENEPTLIAGGDNALATFKSIFGDTPYVFKADQVINGETVRYKGDYEQSYIEAYEYAALGYPIVYERVTPFKLQKASATLNIQRIRATATHTISAGNSESTNAATNVTFTRTGDSAPYTYTADLSENDVFADSWFGARANGENGAYGIDIGDYGYDWNGTNWTSEDDTAVQEGGSVNVEDGSIVIVTNTEIFGAGVTSGTGTVTWWMNVRAYRFTANINNYTAANAQVEFSTNGSSWTDVTSVATYNNAERTYGDLLTAQVNSASSVTFRFSPPNISDEITESATPVVNNTGNTLVIEAKYGGEYGNAIRISVAATNASDLFRLTVVNGENTETFNVSLARDDSAFIGNISSNYIQVSAQSLAAIPGDATGLLIQTQAETALSGGGYQNASTSQPDEFTVAAMYELLTGDSYGAGVADDEATNEFWEKFADKDLNDYGIFTTGAYPLYGGSNDWQAAQRELAAVSEYGLGFALVDAKANVTAQNLSNQSEMQAWVTGTNSRTEPYGAYGAMFFESRTVTTSFGDQELPASFCYVQNFIKQLGLYQPWEATAGTGTNANGRGVVGGIVDKKKLGGSVSDMLQPDIGVRVNPIQYIRNVGNVIMGNATLNNNSRGLVNYSFLNIRVLTAIVKRFWYSLGKTVLFEQNDMVTYLTLKNAGQTFMDTLLDRGLRTEDSNGNAVEPYTIERIATTERATLKIKVSYYPIEAIEKVEEEVELKDGYVNVTEV